MLDIRRRQFLTLLGGEAVACDDNGLASFERIRYRQHDGDVFLYAFDLIESNGDDLRRDPLQVRKATLASILAKAVPASGSTSIWKATARPSSPTPARWGLKVSCRSGRIRLPLRPLARLAQRGCAGREREAEEDWGKGGDRT
jgi:ATP-dependent DNA ligase